MESSYLRSALGRFRRIDPELVMFWRAEHGLLEGREDTSVPANVEHPRPIGAGEGSRLIAEMGERPRGV